MTKFIRKFLFALLLLIIAAAIFGGVMAWISFVAASGFKGWAGFGLSVGPMLCIAAAGIAWVEVRRG